MTRWRRDLDLVVPLWQGGDDVGLADGAFRLAAAIDKAPSRCEVVVPAAGSEAVEGVKHLATVASALDDSREVLREHDPTRILTLGGDCSVEVPPIEHLSTKHKGLVVFWVDAHGDLNTPDTSPSGTAHGMPLRLLLGQGHARLAPRSGRTITPAQVVLVGVRSLDPAEADLIAGSHMRHVTVGSIDIDPRSAARSATPNSSVYIHLDLDVTDPRLFPSVSCPTEGGMGIETLGATLAAIHESHDVVGIGITEYAPVVPHSQGALSPILAALRLAPG